MLEQPLNIRISELLLGLDLSIPSKREALLIWASLDQDLVNQIDYSGAPDEFVPLLVDKLLRYGSLEDGRNAIVAVLQVARGKIGIDNKKVCDALVEELLAVGVSTADQGVASTTIQPYSGYKYDVFISYEANSMFDDWLHELLLPRFEGYLKQYIAPRPIRIKHIRTFPNDNISTYTKIALAHSRVLVAICSNTYFSSVSCKYELAVILQRERRLGYRREDNPNLLIYPVYAFGGDRFPEIISYWDRHCDCNGYTNTSIKHSNSGVEFDRRVRQFAEEVASVVWNPPPWNETFFDDLIPDPTLLGDLEIMSSFSTPPRWT